MGTSKNPEERRILIRKRFRINYTIRVLTELPFMTAPSLHFRLHAKLSAFGVKPAA